MYPTAFFPKSEWGREKGYNIGCVFARHKLGQYCGICIISLNTYDHSLRYRS